MKGTARKDLMFRLKILALLIVGSHTFAPSCSRRRAVKLRSNAQSQATALSMSLDWEQLVYNAESVASTLASSGLKSGSILTSLPIMYGAGLLTSVSPCVWGLLPLTMSYISTAAGERADQQATIPTLVFSAGLASVFCSLGLVAALAGGVFGSSSSGGDFGSFVTTSLSSGVCLAMGLQLLNLVNFSSLVPSLSSFQQSNNDESEEILIDAKGNIMDDSNQNAGGSLLRTFLLGGSSALVASPCATPVLTSILANVASTRDPVLGALYLLGYTLGYSTPLLIVAATGGQALVKLKQGGGWYAKVAPWITPMTGGVLLWYGTNGLLVSLFGDPSMAALAPILE